MVFIMDDNQVRFLILHYFTNLIIIKQLVFIVLALFNMLNKVILLLDCLGVDGVYIYLETKTVSSYGITTVMLQSSSNLLLLLAHFCHFKIITVTSIACESSTSYN